MARPRKAGLDSFPFDVDFFNKEIIAATFGEYGIKGEMTVILLLCAIYRKGYFTLWDDMLKSRLLANLPGVSEQLLESIVRRLVLWGFFDKTLFDSSRVLTSEEIQRTYASMRKQSAAICILPEHNLIGSGSPEAKRVYRNKSRKTPKNSDKSRKTPKVTETQEVTNAENSASCARGESLSLSIDNLDINNKFLNINIPESDSKLISPVDNLDSDNNSDRDKLKFLEENRGYSLQVFEHKQEDKLKNKKDNTTHVREENAAPEIEPAKPPDKKKKSGDERFKVPAVEEVAAYCAERRNNVDAHAWWDFYQSKGWMVGKNKMKDWKAAVRTWEKRDTDTGRKWKRGSTIMEAVSAVARSIEDDKNNKGKKIDLNKLLNG